MLCRKILPFKTLAWLGIAWRLLLGSVLGPKQGPFIRSKHISDINHVVARHYWRRESQDASGCSCASPAAMLRGQTGGQTIA